MNRFARLFLVGLVLFSQACVTQKLWEASDPKARIWIDASDTTEESLKERGVAYQVYHSGRRKGYLIEKSGWRKMADYQFRAFGTPVTLAIDTATTVVVIGIFVVSDPKNLPVCERIIEDLVH